MKKEEELQKKIVQFQVMEANLKALQERAQMISERAEEIQRTIIAIDELEKTKPSKAFVPLGSGNFAQGSIENTEDLMVEIGAGVAIKKKREEAKKILEERVVDFERKLEEMSANSQELLIGMQKIQEELEKMQA